MIASPAPLVALQRPKRRAGHHRHVVAGEVTAEELPDLHLHELQRVSCQTMSALLRNTTMYGRPPGAKRMLRVWARPSAADEDRPVHLARRP